MAAFGRWDLVFLYFLYFLNGVTFIIVAKFKHTHIHTHTTLEHTLWLNLIIGNLLGGSFEYMNFWPNKKKSGANIKAQQDLLLI